MKTTGNVVFVTGGASGLGEGTVRYFAKPEKNNKVVFVDMNEERGKAIEAELGEHTHFIKVDVTDNDQVEAAVKEAVELFGHIDVGITCAGIGAAWKIVGRKGLHPIDAWNRVINIDLNGTFYAVRALADVMRNNEPSNEDGEKGVIVMTSAIAGFEGQIGQSSYTAAKGAINSFTNAASREFGELGIRVSAIAPGPFGTPAMLAVSDAVMEGVLKNMIFPKRLGKVEEFARFCEVMVELPFINGVVYRYGGGYFQTPR